MKPNVALGDPLSCSRQTTATGMTVHQFSRFLILKIFKILQAQSWSKKKKKVLSHTTKNDTIQEKSLFIYIKGFNSYSGIMKLIVTISSVPV